MSSNTPSLYALVRSLLFRLDAEQAHDLTLRWLRVFNTPLLASLLAGVLEVRDPRLQVEAFGLRFKNPIGLAAGYDKNGQAVRALSALGFGHIEVGTVTRRPQPGNPTPRVHRLPEQGAILNSMGFPNRGVEALPHHLSPSPRFTQQPEDLHRLAPTRVGVNIGKSKDTPLDQAADDYCALLRAVYTRADYVSLNLSSPNTPGLRQLQSRQALNELLQAVMATRDSLAWRIPVLVKISPDVTNADLDDILVAVRDHRVDGLIATNTTTRRVDIPETLAALPGGISGVPVRARSTEVIRYIARQTAGQLPLIGVGGIMDPRDVIEKLEAGATLVQIYTGLVYRGPALIRNLNRAILKHRLLA